MMKQRDNKHKIGVVVTLCIILMLIFAGPSSAVMVNLAMDGMQNKQVGQTGFFFFNVTIGGNERIPITDFTIDGLPHISGSLSGTLSFNAGDVGTTVGGIKTDGNYKIELVAIHGWVDGYGYSYGYASNRDDEPYLGYGSGYSFYGHGYGYGYSDPGENQYTKLSYKITVDTTGADPVKYDVTGTVNTGPDNECFSTSTKSFTLGAAQPTPTRRRSTGGGGGTYPPGWDGTPTPTVTATPTVSATGTATAAPPGERVTPRPTITKPTATATEAVAEGAAPKAPKKGVPGFTAVFAIAGLLAIAYLVMRRRE